MKIDKILTIIALLLMTVVLFIIARTPDAAAYEISIYDAYPAYFWFLFIAAFACGIGILLHRAFARETSWWWLAGLLIILFVNTIFILLPAFRGYLCYGREDTLAHLGYIKDILVSGHVGRGNFYPVEHILGTSLIEITGISRESVFYIMSAFFSGMYILCIYLLAKIIASKPGQVLLIVALAAPLIYSGYHVSISPSGFSLFVAPALLYFYHRRARFLSFRIENTIALLVLAFAFVFLHPVTAVFMVVILIFCELAALLYRRFLVPGRSDIGQHGIANKNSWFISLALLAICLFWYLNYAPVQANLRKVYMWLIHGIGPTMLGSTLEQLSLVNLTLQQTVELFISRYGAVFIILIIAGIAFIAVVWWSFSKKRKVEPEEFIYAAFFFIALIIGGAMLFGQFIASDPIRISRFFMMMGTLLAGLVFYNFIGRNHGKASSATGIFRRAGLPAVTGLVIMVVAVLSFGNVYGSVRTAASNLQITQMITSGTQWLIGVSDSQVTARAYDPRLFYRFEQYHSGINIPRENELTVDYDRLPPDIYQTYNEAAELAGEGGAYLAIFDIDRVRPLAYPENVRDMIPQWSADDLEQLEADPTAASIYRNGDFEVWWVSGK